MEEVKKPNAGKKYPAVVISRRLMFDYPTLETEIQVVHLIVRYQDLPPIILDIPKSKWTPEVEDDEVDKAIEAELKRLGRI